MLTTTVLSWLIGNLIGLLAGFRKDKPLSKLLEGIAILMYPIPYYIFALLLIMFFCYLLPVFPLSFVVQERDLTGTYQEHTLELLPARHVSDTGRV